jgi:hypothetical protein
MVLIHCTYCGTTLGRASFLNACVISCMRHSESSLCVWPVLVGVASTATWNEDVLYYYRIHNPPDGMWGTGLQQGSGRGALDTKY